MFNIVKPRKCGDCTECCTALNIAEVNSPSGESCTNICNQGCSIYKTRPNTCQSFKCLWLDSYLLDTQGLTGETPNEVHILPKDWRPDKTGMVITAQSTSFGNHWIVFLTKETHKITPKRETILEALSQTLPVMARWPSGKTRLVGPEEWTKDILNKVNKAKENNKSK